LFLLETRSSRSNMFVIELLMPTPPAHIQTENLGSLNESVTRAVTLLSYTFVVRADLVRYPEDSLHMLSLLGGTEIKNDRISSSNFNHEVYQIWHNTRQVSSRLF